MEEEGRKKLVWIVSRVKNVIASQSAMRNKVTVSISIGRGRLIPCIHT